MVGVGRSQQACRRGASASPGTRRSAAALLWLLPAAGAARGRRRGPSTACVGAARATASTPAAWSSAPVCSSASTARWPGNASAPSTSRPIRCCACSGWWPSGSAPANSRGGRVDAGWTRSRGPWANGCAAAAGPGRPRDPASTARVRWPSLDPGWIRYAPVSFVAPMLGGAAAGGVLQMWEWVGAQAEVIAWVGPTGSGSTPVVWMIAAWSSPPSPRGVVGAFGLWVEMSWNYRLEREPGGTLRVRRGLFTSRSISVEEGRLRGVELVEPLGVRLPGAARLDAVATGPPRSHEDKDADRRTLLPAAPSGIARAGGGPGTAQDPESPLESVHADRPSRGTRDGGCGGRSAASSWSARRCWCWLGRAGSPMYCCTSHGSALSCCSPRSPRSWPLTPTAASATVSASGTWWPAAAPSGGATVALQRGGIIGWTFRQSGLPAPRWAGHGDRDDGGRGRCVRGARRRGERGAW